MFKKQFIVKYQGFHPSEFTKNLIYDVFIEIQNESPEGATFKADILRKNHFYKTVVKIQSSAGHFFAVASGPKLKEVIDKINDQLRKQIDRWKTNRIKHKGLKEKLINKIGNTTEGPFYDFKPIS